MQDDARDPEAPAVQRCLQGFGVALQLGDDEYPVLTPEVTRFLRMLGHTYRHSSGEGSYSCLVTFLIGVLLLGMWLLFVDDFRSFQKDATAYLHLLFLGLFTLSRRWQISARIQRERLRRVGDQTGSQQGEHGVRRQQDRQCAHPPPHHGSIASRSVGVKTSEVHHRGTSRARWHAPGDGPPTADRVTRQRLKGRVDLH